MLPSRCQVLIFNLLPPPGSAPLQPDERGAAWSAPPLAVEVQAQVVDAMERVSRLQQVHRAVLFFVTSFDLLRNFQPMSGC
jgi:hypothetical protein